MRLVGLVDDLFFIAKIETIVNQLGLNIKFLPADSILNRDFDFVIVDMENKDAFTIIEKFPSAALCFGSHVKKELFQKANKLGCKKAFPRSVFFDKLSEMLA